MTATASEARPHTMTGEEIRNRQGSGTTKKEEPWQLRSDLWRFKILDKIIEDLSGMGGDTTEDFQKYYAMCFSERQMGLDCDEEIACLLEYARISGDKQGKNKVQIVQMVEDKAAVFPMAGGLYPAEQEKPGFWESLKMKLSGEKPQ